MKRNILIAAVATLGLATSAYAATTTQQTPVVKAAAHKGKASHMAAKNAKAQAKAAKKAEKKEAKNS